MDNLEITIKRVLQTAAISDDHATHLNDKIKKILNKIDAHSLIDRSKAYFPIGGYVEEHDCVTEWIEHDTIEFTAKGWYYTSVGYRVIYTSNADEICSKYQKISYRRSNVNGRGGYIEKTFDDEPMLDEESMLNDMRECIAE